MESERIIIKQRLEDTDSEAGARRSSKSKVGKKKKKSKSGSKKYRERMIALASLVLIFIAWLIGSYRESTDIEPFLYQAIPTAERIEKSENGNYAAYAADELLGYVTVGVGTGYGGPIQLAVATDLEGKITGLSVVRHIETPSFFFRVNRDGLISRMVGKDYLDAFDLNSDVDGVSGATYTSRGVADAVSDGSRRIAQDELGFTVPERAPAKIEFGIPEIVLLALFAIGTIGRKYSTKHTKKMRWASLLTGLIVLGFIYTTPMTIAFINKMLLGFWPDWHTHLYWYMLIIGIVFSLTAFEKNAYCEWFCPFGAAQECMGKIGGAKAPNVRRFQAQLRWLQRSVSLAAIVIALIYRNPGITSYEVFGTLFDLEGNIPQFWLMGMVLLASLIIHRPWCRYLCPLHPIEAFIKLFNNWIKELWPKARPVEKAQEMPKTQKSH